MKGKTSELNFIALTFILTCVLFMGFTLCGCGKSGSTDEATKTWDMYVQAVKEGNAEQAMNFWTKESREYFDLMSERERFWLDQQLTIVKAESDGDMVKLQLLAEKDGQEKGFFEYLIMQDEKYFLQYPFLIFAKSWPTMKSLHFIYHSVVLPDSAKSDLGDEMFFPDTTAVEDFLARIQRLTGIQYAGTIDYYFCHSREEVAELSGFAFAFPRRVIGSCVVTSENHSFAAITEIVTEGSSKPIDLMYYGLLGYAELERARMEKGAIERADFTTAEHFQKLGEHPLLSLMKVQEAQDERQLRADLWIVGGALIDLLIAEGGEEKFRELYESSDTEQSFENGLSTIYSTDLETLEKKLQEKYGS